MDHLRPGARLATLLLLATAVLSPAIGPVEARAGRQAPEGPTDALSPAERELALPLDLTPRLHLLAARERMRSGDVEGARAELGQVRALDPRLVEPLLATAWLDLRRSPGAAVQGVVEALKTAAGHFTWQSTTAAGAAWGLIAVTLVAVTLLAGAYAGQAVGVLHHLLTEHLRTGNDLKIASASASLILILPLLWGAGPLVAALALLLLAGPGRPAAERSLLAVGCALIVFLGLAPRLAPGFLRPMDFRDKAQVLDLAQHAPLNPVLADRLDKMSSEGVDLALLVKGNAHYRAGEGAAAEPLFARYAAAQPNDARGPLAVGNCRLLAGDPNAALAHYRRAAALDPMAAEPHVNLALAHSLLLQFELANAALAEAARLDKSAVAEVGAAAAEPGDGTTGTGIRQSSPLTIDVRPAELWSILGAERRQWGVNPPGYLRPWLPWQGGGAWPLAFLALAVAFVAGRPLNSGLRIFWCSGCGSAICRRCVTRRRGLALCRRCERRHLSSSSANGLLVVSGRGRGPRRGDRLKRWAWNLSLPGYGLIEASHPVVAAFLVTAIAAAWIGFQTAGHPIPPLAPAPAAPAWGWLSSGLGAALLASLWLATAALGVRTRPALGSKHRGRITPLVARPAGAVRQPVGQPQAWSRTGTEG